MVLSRSASTSIGTPLSASAREDLALMGGQRGPDRVAQRPQELGVLQPLLGGTPGVRRTAATLRRRADLAAVPRSPARLHARLQQANLYAQVVKRLAPRKLSSLPRIAISASSAAWVARSSSRSRRDERAGSAGGRARSARAKQQGVKLLERLLSRAGRPAQRGDPCSVTPRRGMARPARSRGPPGEHKEGCERGASESWRPPLSSSYLVRLSRGHASRVRSAIRRGDAGEAAAAQPRRTAGTVTPLDARHAAEG